jgi:hypothetical protein
MDDVTFFLALTSLKLGAEASWAIGDGRDDGDTT